MAVDGSCRSRSGAPDLIPLLLPWLLTSIFKVLGVFLLCHTQLGLPPTQYFYGISSSCPSLQLCFDPFQKPRLLGIFSSYSDLLLIPPQLSPCLPLSSWLESTQRAWGPSHLSLDTFHFLSVCFS